MWGRGPAQRKKIFLKKNILLTDNILTDTHEILTEGAGKGLLGTQKEVISDLKGEYQFLSKDIYCRSLNDWSLEIDLDFTAHSIMKSLSELVPPAWWTEARNLVWFGK
jgi:hypothetical protein